MSDNIKELVKRLREEADHQHDLAHDCDCAPEATANWTAMLDIRSAADALEAMVKYRADYEAMKAHNNELFGKLSAAEAARDRLACEVEKLKEILGFKASLTAEMVQLNKERQAAEAERDRMKAALDVAKDHAKQNQRVRDSVSPYPNDHAKRIVWEKTLYHEGKDLWDKLHKALGGDAS